MAATACRPAQRITIRAGLLLDGRGDSTRDALITVQNGRIASIAPWHGETVTYDLSRYTVLPGLIDAHVHLNGFFDHQGRLANTDDGETPADRDAERAALALATLRAGFTTVASMGADAEKKLRDDINAGRIPGPRVLTSLAQIRDSSLSPDALRQAVRERAADGADFIKVFASPALGGGDGPTLTLAQLSAVCGEAHRLKLRSVVHAHDDASVRLAIAAGCTEIEHGFGADSSTLRLMAEHGIPFDPQCGLVLHNYLDNQARFDVPGGMDSATFALMPALLVRLPEVLRMARATAGLKVLYGTDATAGAHGRNAEDLICWVRQAAQDPMDALVTATSINAGALGLGDSIGTIATGYLADLIAVDGNPLWEIEAVRRMKFVMKGGVVYRSD